MTKEQIQKANKDFIIDVSGKNYIGPYFEKLVTVKSLRKMIGEELANKYIKKAYEKGLDEVTFKLRRGIKIRVRSKIL